jgi:hypothetical protein
MPRSLARAATASAAYLIAATCAIVALPSTSQAQPASWACPGYPMICQESCRLDEFDTPIYCEGGLCVCAPGYDTETGPNGIVCEPHQPDFMPSFSDVAACPATCEALPPAVRPFFCPDSCTPDPWGFPGSISNPFDLVPVHGTSPGGEAFMPVWGQQANNCGKHGVATTTTDADGHPIRTWNGCAVDAHPFCTEIQSADEADWNPPSCSSSEGCGENGFCTSDFTSAWPYLDDSDVCKVLSSLGAIAGQTDPARIDFPNNVIVYRAPIAWENHGDEDDDYTWNMHSGGHELYDTDTQYAYQNGGGRVHIEFDSDETIDHFTDDDWGAANKFWRDLRNAVDNSNGSDNRKDQNIRCFLKSFVNPTLTFDTATLTCPLSEDDSDTCGDGKLDTCGDDGLRDPVAVVVGVPSLDCADNDRVGTDEIHPAYAMAIRIQEDPSQPEEWTFFYHRKGNNGPCGTEHYGRCGTTFRLPLGLPVVPDTKVLTSADVQVDAHAWAGDDSSPSDVTVEPTFDLLKGTVLTITLPDDKDGVVGHVTVTPVVDTTPPQITCPGSISKPVDLGNCTAVVTFTPTISDNCSVSAACSPPSGSAFPIGMTTDTCTATDQAGLSASCSFTVTVTAGNKCPLGQAHWENHTNLWAVNSLTLGSVTYTQAQLNSILNIRSRGDASVILAKQLIAVLLNLANGSNPVPVCNTIAAANSALDGCTVPCAISPKSPTGKTMISDANSLEMYNRIPPKRRHRNCTGPSGP